MEARISEEWNILFGSPMPNARVHLQGASMKSWIATIDGPKNTPYEGGEFIVFVIFGDEYPQKPPIFIMHTKIFHVNITEKGYICLSILKEDYKPEYHIGYMISCIVYLLAHPNPSNGFLGAALDLYKANVIEYEAKARNMTKEHAQPCFSLL